MMCRALPLLLLALLLQGCNTFNGVVSSSPTQPQGRGGAQENLLDKIHISPPPVSKSAPAGNMLAPQVRQEGQVPRRAVLLLPLSGQHAVVGNQLLQAVQLAVQDLAPATFTVAPYDTANGAAAALQNALRQRTDIIIGPLFSVDVATTKAIAEAESIPMLALSNDEMQSDKNTFLMGASPAMQVQRVLDYAARNGVRSVVAIVPNTTYGQAIIAALQTAPVNVVKVLSYSTAMPNVPSVMQQVASLYGKFDAVLLPEAGASGVHIATALRQSGMLQNIHLLGSSQWDDNAATAAFNGGWYATLDKQALADFTKRYSAAFGSAPPLAATFAYDAAALTALIAANGWGYDVTTLTQDQGFAGMAGAFRLRIGGEVQRALSVHEITPSGYKTLEAAPNRL